MILIKFFNNLPYIFTKNQKLILILILILAVKDACSKVMTLNEAFDTTREVSQLEKKSPKRETYLKKLRLESGNKEKNAHVFCPTRWTVHGVTLAAIINNHEELMLLWSESLKSTTDTEMKGRIIGAKARWKLFLISMAAS